MAFSPIESFQEMLASIGFGKGHWEVLRCHRRFVLKMYILAPSGMAVTPWRSKANTPRRVGSV